MLKNQLQGFKYAVLVSMILFLSILNGFSADTRLLNEKGNQSQKFQIIKDQGGVIELSESQFSVDQPKFYIYRFPENSVRFFVLKSSDGVIRAALDSCDVCYAARKGFRQEGDYTVCNNCGNAYPSVKINVETGGCNPVSLVRTVKKGKVVILVKDLKAGLKYFNF